MIRQQPTEVHAPAHIAQNSDSEHSMKVTSKSRKHRIFTRFSERPKLRRLLENQNNKKNNCRKRTGEALPRAEKFGDLITADHKVLKEGCESRDIHQYAVMVQRSCHSMVSILSVQNKSSHETKKRLLKFLEPSQAPKVVYTDNSLVIWESM